MSNYDKQKLYLVIYWVWGRECETQSTKTTGCFVRQCTLKNSDFYGYVVCQELIFPLKNSICKLIFLFCYIKADGNLPSTTKFSKLPLPTHTRTQSMFFSQSVLMRWIGGWKEQCTSVVEAQLSLFILCSRCVTSAFGRYGVAFV